MQIHAISWCLKDDVSFTPLDKMASISQMILSETRNHYPNYKNPSQAVDIWFTSHSVVRSNPTLFMQMCTQHVSCRIFDHFQDIQDPV